MVKEGRALSATRLCRIVWLSRGPSGKCLEYGQHRLTGSGRRGSRMPTAENALPAVRLVICFRHHRVLFVARYRGKATRRDSLILLQSERTKALSL